MELTIADGCARTAAVTARPNESTPQAKRTNDGPQNLCAQVLEPTQARTSRCAGHIHSHARQDQLADITPQFPWLGVIILMRAADF